jgi:hypothetical protein
MSIERTLTLGFGNGSLAGDIGETLTLGFDFGVVVFSEVDPFSFLDVINVARSTVIESNEITVTGINIAVDISIINGEYSINDGAYTSAAGTVENGDTVKVRHTSSANYLPANGSNSTGVTETLLTISQFTDSFRTFTTINAPSIPSAKPKTRHTTIKTLSIALGGPETSYDVYRFSGGKRFYERPNHNPFD